MKTKKKSDDIWCLICYDLSTSHCYFTSEWPGMLIGV